MSDDATTPAAAPDATPPADLSATSSGGGKVTMIGGGLLAFGAILSGIAFSQDGNRFGFGYMIGFAFVWAIVLGSLFFVALQHATSSVWSVVLRRVGEMLASPMILLAILFIPLALTALLNPETTIFPWRNPTTEMAEHAVHVKGSYLNESGFIIRTLLFFAIWIFFTWFFVSGSLKQDGGGKESLTERMRRFSPIFLILFGFTVTFASFDWLMSLEPNWFSTIYGVYVFGGMTLSALAAITIGLHLLKRNGKIAPELIRGDHVYSLGGLLFAFTCFWGYIAFSQFMLIWYANMPEETVYFTKRLDHGWGGVTVALAFIRFVIPFFMLLSRQTKMNLGRLAGISAFILFGQLVDLYWLVMPNYFGADGPGLGYQEIGPVLLFSGVLLLAVGRFMGRHAMVASKDPGFEASKQFHLH
ncbi:MAG: quinol:cytochrome C oxidoreductase [Planctomycetota bacterium]|nr:quinol:cytochrome C oxidoreductase [Planctomycetota bacterium]